MAKDDLCFRKVTRVLDGDTVYIETLGYCRLIGIDAPEIEQVGWGTAKIYLESLVKNQMVEVELCKIRPTDFYLRKRVILRWRGINVNQAMIESGLARVWELKPCHTRATKWKKLTDEERYKIIFFFHLDKTWAKTVGKADPVRVGDRMTKVFHVSGCRFVPERPHKTLLPSEKIAKQFGYAPCPMCRGDGWLDQLTPMSPGA